MLISMFNLSVKVLIIILDGNVTEKVEYSFFNSSDESIVVEKHNHTDSDGVRVVSYKRYFGLGFSCNSEIYVDTNIDNINLDDNNIKKAISEVASLKNIKDVSLIKIKRNMDFLI